MPHTLQDYKIAVDEIQNKNNNMKQMMQLVKLSKPKFQGMLWQDLEWTSRVKELWILESVLSSDTA